MPELEKSGTPTDEVLETKEVEILDESEDDSTEDINSKEESTEESIKPKPEDEELDLDIDFLGKPTKVKKSEAKPLIQKGMNYDHVKAKADKAEQELAALKAQLAEKELAEQKRDMEKQLVDAGLDADEVMKFINNHPVIKKAEEISRNAEAKANEIARQVSINQEKDTLRKEPYFNELEKEVDSIIASNPNTSLSVAYEFLLGRMMRTGKLNELKETTQKATQKATIADLQDKAMRGKSISGDGGEEEDVEPNRLLNKDGLELTRAWGNNAKNIAKYVKNQLKKG
jgi:hypothetical protein